MRGGHEVVHSTVGRWGIWKTLEEKGGEKEGEEEANGESAEYLGHMCRI